MRELFGGDKRTEINFFRLLNRCENMMKDSDSTFGWRVEKYIDTLREYLCQLKKMSVNQPRHEDLIDYTRRVDLLVGIMEANKMSNAAEKVLAMNQLTPGINSNYQESTDDNLKLFSRNLSHQIHAGTKARYLKDMREELLETSTKSSLRSRKSNLPEGDVNAVMKHHQQMQEKFADEMVHLARNLKENVTLAGRIVREDKEKLQNSTAQAEDNFSRLKVESERLEYHVQRVCSWWIWIMLVLVVITFVWMVIFMKIYPKHR